MAGSKNRNTDVGVTDASHNAGASSFHRSWATKLQVIDWSSLTGLTPLDAGTLFWINKSWALTFEQLFSEGRTIQSSWMFYSIHICTCQESRLYEYQHLPYLPRSHWCQQIPAIPAFVSATVASGHSSPVSCGEVQLCALASAKSEKTSQKPKINS